MDIRDNLEARIIEAKRAGWLGEVEGLQVSLTGAKDKIDQIDAASRTIRHRTGHAIVQPGGRAGVHDSGEQQRQVAWHRP